MSEYKAASVIGLSSLRANEPGANAAPPKDNKRAEYLSKYMLGDDADGKKKKRKKKKKAAAVHVVDEDVGWPAEDKHPRGAEEAGAPTQEDDDEEGPVVENAAEVQHQLRLMQSQQQFQTQWEGEQSPGAVRRERAPPRARHNSDDESPPRRRARHDSGDESPPRRRARHDSDDESPPRRRARHDSDDDSPPRRKARHDSDDESPPRRQAAGQSTQPGRPTVRHDSDNESPVRRRPGLSGGSRAAPQQRQRHDSDDESPPRRPSGTAAADRSDAGGSGAQRHDDDDESPPRRSRQTGLQGAKGAPSKERGSARDSGPTKAPLAGLVAPEEMAAQIREDRERRKQMDAVASGRDAEAAYRVQGRVVSKEEFKEAQNSKQTKKQPKYIEEDVSWKSGLVQRKAAEAQHLAQEQEGRKKFQRGFDDTADAQLQQELRMEDPMAQYFESKKLDALSSADAAAPSAVYDAELGSGSGFSVPQQVPEHSWIRRGVQALPNRYRIKPGRHWDGVHRSNGFEKKFIFQYQHKKAERARDEYVLAEDM